MEGDSVTGRETENGLVKGKKVEQERGSLQGGTLEGGFLFKRKVVLICL